MDVNDVRATAATANPWNLNAAVHIDSSTRKRLEDLWDESLRRPDKQRGLDCIRGLPEGEQLQTGLLYALRISSNAFEELRYFYETKRSHFLLDDFPDMLHAVILEKFPEFRHSHFGCSMAC